MTDAQKVKAAIAFFMDGKTRQFTTIEMAHHGCILAAALESAAPRNTDPSALTHANVIAHLINTNESLTREQYRAMSAGVDALRAAAPTVREAEPTPEMKVECAKCFDSGLLSVAYHQIPCGECLAGDRARASLERQGFLAEGR